MEQLPNNEPLPPGVDALEIEVPVTKVKQSHFLLTSTFNAIYLQADTLNSALSSFYSEMATIATPTVANEVVKPEENNAQVLDNVGDKVKKKKKTKVTDFLVVGLIFTDCVWFLGENRPWIGDEKKGSFKTRREMEECTK